jgi:hypothetical protein
MKPAFFFHPVNDDMEPAESRLRRIGSNPASSGEPEQTASPLRRESGK